MAKRTKAMGTTVSAFQDVDGIQRPILINLEDFIAEQVAERVETLVKAYTPKPGKPSKPEKGMTTLGVGASYHVEDGKLYIVVDVSPEAHRRAKLSNNKRNFLIASSKGNPMLEGSPIPGLRIALNLYTEESPTPGEGS